MSGKRLPLTIGAGIVCVGIGVGTMIAPVAAGGQQAGSPERVTRIYLTATAPKQTPKAHWGIYSLARYDYSPSGKMTVTKKNDLIAEEDLGIGGGKVTAYTDVRLSAGEYEIHLQPDNSRPVVKRFIVNNLSASIIPLAFTVAPIEDMDERKKTEVVRLGPSLADLEARIAALEKKSGVASAGEAKKGEAAVTR